MLGVQESVNENKSQADVCNVFKNQCGSSPPVRCAWTRTLSRAALTGAGQLSFGSSAMSVCTYGQSEVGKTFLVKKQQLEAGCRTRAGQQGQRSHGGWHTGGAQQ